MLGWFKKDGRDLCRTLGRFWHIVRLWRQGLVKGKRGRGGKKGSFVSRRGWGFRLRGRSGHRIVQIMFTLHMFEGWCEARVCLVTGNDTHPRETMFM